jgi:hypothetical protein
VPCDVRAGVKCLNQHQTLGSLSLDTVCKLPSEVS